MNWALRLYPEWWRTRYGDEMSALMEEVPPSLGTVVDLMKGAVMAHLEAEPTPATGIASSAGAIALGRPPRRIPRPGRLAVAALLLPALVTVAMGALLRMYPHLGTEVLPGPLFLTWSLISNRHLVLGLTIMGAAIAMWRALVTPRGGAWMVGAVVAFGLLVGIVSIYLGF